MKLDFFLINSSDCLICRWPSLPPPTEFSVDTCVLWTCTG